MTEPNLLVSVVGIVGDPSASLLMDKSGDSEMLPVGQEVEGDGGHGGRRRQAGVEHRVGVR